MRDQILALVAATAFGLAPAWTGASEDLKGNSRTDEAAASGLAPTPEELAHATYTGIEDQGPVTLRAGKWEGPPLIEGGASVPALWLSEGFHLTGDLDQDGADEAVVHLTYSSGGTGNFGYLAVMDREGADIVQRAIGLVGDRVQIRAARIDGGSVVLDVLQAGPDDGMCCPRQLATRTFGIQSGKLVETDIKVTGTASLAMLDGTAWVLRKLDGREGEALPGQATLAFASGKVSGSTGCNQFQGTVSEGESATSLVIGPLITTRKACAEPLMAQEHTFLERLGQTEGFQFLLGDLVLSAANGALVFSPRVD
ncbi:MAG: META domain-containing protein [Pseudomonadota bacterium]|nr:META domain-containing protein [Pseudomonadota bacterium]